MKSVFAIEREVNGEVHYLVCNITGFDFQPDPDSAITFSDRASAEAVADFMREHEEGMAVQQYDLEEEIPHGPRVWHTHTERLEIFQRPVYEESDGKANETAVETALLRVMQGYKISPEDLVMLLRDRDAKIAGGDYKPIERWQVTK